MKDIETIRSTPERLFGVTTLLPPPTPLTPPIVTEGNAGPVGGGNAPFPWLAFLLGLGFTAIGVFIVFKITESRIYESEGRVMAAIPKTPVAKDTEPESTIASQPKVNPSQRDINLKETQAVRKDRSDYLL